jgi:PhnB protein
MQLSTYLNFNGQCEAAFKFYEKSLGGKILFMGTYTGSPMADQMPPEWGHKIMHATLTIGGHELMGCDVAPNRFEAPKGFSVTLAFNDLAEAERVFNALAENGKVSMPMQKTFWAAGFGMLVDQFGIPWMINCGSGA